VKDAENVDRVLPAVAAVAPPPGLEIHTWRALAKNITDIIKYQNVFLGVASFVFLLIALTLIVNTMIMAVLERVREIGTMMAVGVRRRQVLGLFLIESALLSRIRVMDGLRTAVEGTTTWNGVRLAYVDPELRPIARELALGLAIRTQTWFVSVVAASAA